MKAIKIICRIIALPFYMVMVIIPVLRMYFTHIICWLLYGGESIAYRKDFNPLTIQESLEKLNSLKQ